MMNLKQLIRKFGNEKKIPDEELARAGLVRWGDLVLSKAEYQQMQHLPVPKLRRSEPRLRYSVEEEEENREFEEANNPINIQIEEERRAQLERLYAGPAGQRVSPEIKGRIEESLDNRGFFRSAPEEDTMIDGENWEEIKFLSDANQFMAGKILPNYALNAMDIVINRFLERETNLGEVSLPKFERALEEATSDALKQKQREFKSKDVSEEIKKEFESQYGPINFAGWGPFESYAFRRVILGEQNPSQFWGRPLFEARKKLIQRFGNVKDIERFVDYIYDSEAGNCADGIFSGDRAGLESILDSVPQRIEEFERDSKKDGVAIAFLDNEGFFIDSDWLRKNEWLQKVLIDIQKAEFPDKFKKGTKPSHLDDITIAESKKRKILRLSNYSEDYDTLVKKTIEGDNEYIDSFQENIQVTQELQALGVNTSIFYAGLTQRDFVVENGKASDLSEIKKEYLAEYRESLEQMLSGNAVNFPERLEAKLVDVVKKSGASIPEGKAPRDYMLELEDEAQLKVVCNTCAEYSARAQNVRDPQATAAAIHHFRNLGNLFKARHRKEESMGRYSIKHSQKNPLTEIDIGNDAGCCIGIYENSNENVWGENVEVENFIKYLREGADFKSNEPVEENGCYMPFYLKDRATQFLELYRGDERSGLALMFAGRNERNEPVLLVNSIELSDRLRTDPHKGQVLEETAQYIRDYAHASGFKHVIISNHSYNPGRITSKEKADFEQFTKVHPWNDDFYSDIMHNSKEGYITKTNFCGKL